MSQAPPKPNKAPKSRRSIRGAAIFFCGLALFLFIDYLGFWQGIDSWCYDISFRLRGARATHPDIKIIAIDEDSIARLGPWPISRSHYAELLKILDQARAVGFDIVLADPQPEDARLKEAISQNGTAVLPMYIDRQHNLILPQPILRDTATGHIHLEPGLDGILRQVYHEIIHQKQRLKSFTTILAELARPLSQERKESAAARPVSPLSGSIYQTVPMLINYYGPAKSYPHYPLAEVLAGRWPAGHFKNSYCLVGITAAGIEPFFFTPFGQNRNHIAGVEIHAHILNNLLDNTQVLPLSTPVTYVTVVVWALLVFWWLSRMPAARTPFWGGGLLLATLTFIFAAFAGFNRWIPPAGYLFAIIFSLGLSYLFRMESLSLLLRSARDDWRESFRTINDAIVILDGDCRVMSANPAAKKQFGKPLFKLLRKRCIDLEQSFSDGPDDKIPPPTAENAQNPALVEEVFAPEIDKHLEIKVFIRTDAQQRFSGTINVVRDITERIVSAQEQENLQRQLIQTQKMEALGTLAGGIAHDFNNILSGILGYGELALQDAEPGTEIAENLTGVLEGGQRASDLVRQILTFSRQSRSEREALQIKALIKESLRLLRATLPTTIEVHQDLEDDPLVEAESTHIHQIVMNLCTNASHAMAETGGGTLSIGVEQTCLATDFTDLHPQMDPGDYIKLTVHDTGPGIPAEIQEHIFEPFFTTKAEGKGTGMGLSVTRGIIVSYGGTITMNSSPDSGTTFLIYLPAVEAEAMQPELEALQLQFGSERILLVDDERFHLDASRHVLERLGYSVLATNNSAEALALFEQDPHHFDLVITDMTMPRLTGEELGRKLLAIRPELPMIICTGYSETLDENRAYELGFKGFVMKPVVMKKISTVIRDVLEA